VNGVFLALSQGAASLRDAQFRWLWCASALYAFAQWMERTAIGWLVLDETGSVFLTALTWAVRIAPGTFLGPIAGAVADRTSRSTILAVATLVKIVALLVMGVLTVAGVFNVAMVLVILVVAGGSMTFTITAMQPLVRDIVGPERAMNAIALNSFGQRAVGSFGALAAGFLITWMGPGETLLVAVGILVVAAAGFAAIRSAPPPVRAGGLFRDAADGLRLVFRVKLVALLLGLVVVSENLGFAFNALLPAIAEEVLAVGPEGLGLLGTAVGMGSIVGTLGLALLGDFPRKGILLAGVIIAFGALLLAMAGTDVYLLALAIAAGLGAAMAAVDALEWIILQAEVPDEYRGRVIGAWNVCIGLGWLGPVVIGAMAELVGIPVALAAFGVVLSLSGALSLRSRQLRAA
jgi:MFS family permease